MEIHNKDLSKELVKLAMCQNKSPSQVFQFNQWTLIHLLKLQANLLLTFIIVTMIRSIWTQQNMNQRYLIRTRKEPNTFLLLTCNQIIWLHLMGILEFDRFLNDELLMKILSPNRLLLNTQMKIKKIMVLLQMHLLVHPINLWLPNPMICSNLPLLQIQSALQQQRE